MKRLLFFGCWLVAVAALGIGTSEAQQRYIKVFAGGDEVYSAPTTGSNSLRFANGNAMFIHNGTISPIAITAIDSMVFVTITDSIPNTDPDTTSGNDTVAVDTASAISIVWDGDSVTIVNPYASQGVGISSVGGHVTVNSTIDSAYLPYLLKGSSTDGSLTVTTEEKVLLRLDSLSLASASGPAICMLSDRKLVLDLVGDNSLADAAGGTHKGALQAQGKLAFQGSGSLSVSGMTKHAIQSAGRCAMNSGTVNVLTAVKDGMNVDDFVMYGGSVSVTNPNGDGIDGDQGLVEINGGTVTVNCSAADAKGICCDSSMTISGGTVNVTVSGNQSKGLKSGGNMLITDGDITVNANGTVVVTNYNPSYCSGLKVGGNLIMTGGTLTSTCSSSNAGGKAVNVDGNITIGGGTLNLTALGNCVKYSSSATTYDSYASACLKANGNISVSGGTITANAGGRAITTDRNYSQSGGSVTTSTNKAGFTVTGSGTSCTDGFAAACLKADSNITFTGGSFNGASTGTGGRGIVANGTLTVGTLGAADSLLSIYVTTSGAPVNASSGGGWGGGSSSDYWKGLPKGVKIEGNITINSGHLQSYCSQTSGSTTGEAIESKDSLFIHGGTVEANAYDDAINANSYINITGGKVWAYARGNDGMDCNGTRIDISGGTVICRGTEVAIDDNGDRNGKLYITGGTIVLVGGNMGTTEATPQVTGQKSIKITSNTSTLLTNGIAIKNETSGNVVVTFKWLTVSGNGFVTYTPSPLFNGPKPPPGGSSSPIYISSPDLQTGSTYKYYSSPTISGGTNWHGLYSGATVTTSGSGTNLTLQ